MAKKESIIGIGGWDGNVRVGDHTEFSIRAKSNGLCGGFTNNLSARHSAVINLTAHSLRSNMDKTKYLLEKYGCNGMIRRSDRRDIEIAIAQRDGIVLRRYECEGSLRGVFGEIGREMSSV